MQQSPLPHPTNHTNRPAGIQSMAPEAYSINATRLPNQSPPPQNPPNRNRPENQIPHHRTPKHHPSNHRPRPQPQLLQNGPPSLLQRNPNPPPPSPPPPLQELHPPKHQEGNGFLQPDKSPTLCSLFVSHPLTPHHKPTNLEQTLLDNHQQIPHQRTPHLQPTPHNHNPNIRPPKLSPSIPPLHPHLSRP